MRCSFLKGAQLMFCDELFYDRSFVTDATTMKSWVEVVSQRVEYDLPLTSIM